METNLLYNRRYCLLIHVYTVFLQFDDKYLKVMKWKFTWPINCINYYISDWICVFTFWLWFWLWFWFLLWFWLWLGMFYFMSNVRLCRDENCENANYKSSHASVTQNLQFIIAWLLWLFKWRQLVVSSTQLHTHSETYKRTFSTENKFLICVHHLQKSSL